MSWSTYDPDGVHTERGDDATRTVTNGAGQHVRDYTQAENQAADQAIADDARLTDLEARVARIEAHLWPAPPDPATPTDAPEWADLAGVWPAGALLLDAGTVWRNVSGVPLTTPPSGFPGDPGQWGHLFVVALDADGEPPTDPEPGAPAWAEGVTYKVGDRVTFAGAAYVCLQAHTSQAGWTPAAVPSLWAQEGV